MFHVEPNNKNIIKILNYIAKKVKNNYFYYQVAVKVFSNKKNTNNYF